MNYQEKIKGLEEENLRLSEELQKTKEWNDRLYKLENEIKYWSTPENISSKTINIINLFYNT